MRRFDLVLFGASGFTGRLVAERLARRIPPSLRWAVAGRNGDSLRRLAATLARDGSSQEGGPQVVEADADDLPAMRALAEGTRLVLTTAGPYRSHGTNLVRACAEAGTDYLDLAGEADWVGDMIRAHDRAARASGARVVPCCGFDSVPSEMGVYCLQSLCRERWGVPAGFVAGRVTDFAAEYSGGTLATAAEMAADMEKDGRLARRLADPFLLTPGFRGPEQPSLSEPRWNPVTAGWVAPFLMSAINTKVVHRSNLLLGHAYGPGFRYDEMVVAPGEAGGTEARARELAALDPMARRDVAPGQGPSREALASGHFELLFIGEHPERGRLSLSVRGREEPAYTTSASIVAEAALCLLQDGIAPGGGFWTPVALMGTALVDRLAAHAAVAVRPPAWRAPAGTDTRDAGSAPCAS